MWLCHCFGYLQGPQCSRKPDLSPGYSSAFSGEMQVARSLVNTMV